MAYPAYAVYQQPSCHSSREVPSNWEFRRLKFSVTYNDESLPETTDPDFEITYVDISSVNLVNGITATEEVTFEEAPSRARRIVQDGDTIISTVRTYLKAIAPIEDPPENMIVSTGFAVIRPLESVNQRFLGYVLQNANFVGEVVAHSTGVSYPAINPSTLVCIPFSYPKNSAEQQKIADFLDWKTGQIDGLIAKKKQLIEKLQEKRIALITRAVTKGLNPKAPMRDSGIPWLGEVPEHWEVKRIKFSSIDGKGRGIQIGPFGGMLTDAIYSETGEYKLYGQENVLSGDFEKGTRWLTAKQYATLSNYWTQVDDILFTRKGSIGGCAVFPSMAMPGIIDSDTIRLRVQRESIETRFLLSAFRYSAYLQYQVQLIKRGAILSGLNTSTIANLQFVSPPLPEQIDICEFLDLEIGKIDELALKVESAIDRITEYRTALITDATTGKIDVREFKIGGAT